MEANNMAAMRAALREALKKARLFIGCSLFKVVEVNFGYLDRDELCTEIDAALSAPARNCDMPYNDRVEMYGAFKDLCKAKGRTMEPMLAYDAFDWLLAPAAERKGGRDVR